MGKVAVLCAAMVCTAAVFVLLRAAVVCMVAAALTMVIRQMKCFRRNTVMCIARNISRKLGYARGYPPELVFELHSMGTYLYCWLEWTDRSFGKVKHFEFHHLSDLQGGVQRISEVRIDFEASKLLEAIQQLKPRIKQDCLDFLNSPCLYNFYNDNPPPSMRDNPAILGNFDTDKLSEFLRGIVAILGGLLLWKRYALSDVKVQIESLKDNLDLISEVLVFTKEGCCHFEEFEKFKIRFQVLAWKAAALSLLYWAQDLENEKMPPSMAVVLSDLLKKSNPFTDPEVTPMHLAALTKLSKPPPEIRFTTGRLAHKFVGALKVIQVDPENPTFQTLFIELIFLITFLMDRHQVKGLPEGESILTLVNNLVDEVLPLICSLNSGEIKEGIAMENNFLLHNFLEKANLVKADVRKIYIHIFSDSSSFNFPRINMNVLRFIDLLLENLKGSCFRFPNLPIMMLREELLSLRELNFEDFSIAEIQNKHKEIKDLWARLVKMAYNAERAVNSFMYMKFLWHDILHFSDVIEELKLIKGEIKRIRDQPMYDIHASNLVKSSETLLPLQANIPTAEEVVGLKNEVQLLVDRLIEGPKELDIVSIVGMPGLGKTTLATKVYVSVKFHFHQHAWCTVSQTFDSQRMLSEIARSIGVRDNDLSHEKEEDLAHKVYKSLKGQRYLIVMDDIWDVAAWNALKMSFPDDKIGSRIMFTSRIRELVSEARPGCVPFPLKPLTDNESWELLQKKLFDKDSCPTNCDKIGKQIATNCKGLPLSVILVAGLLKKSIEDMDWWKQVGERLDSLSVNEDCKALLELSYKHLPEVLKPCFLYLGSFSEDEEIKVNSLVNRRAKV